MSRRILKFPIGAYMPTTLATVDQPRILAVDWQGEQLVVWVETEPGPGQVWTVLQAVMTGQEVPAGCEYVGTAQHPTLNMGGPLVVHVYRQLTP